MKFVMVACRINFVYSDLPCGRSFCRQNIFHLGGRAGHSITGRNLNAASLLTTIKVPEFCLVVFVMKLGQFNKESVLVSLQLVKAYYLANMVVCILHGCITGTGRQ